MRIYTGVPIGGTIAWLGHLAGLEKPDNFIYNHLPIPSEPRKNLDFTRADYNDWQMEGYLTGVSENATSNDGKNLINLKANQIPSLRNYRYEKTHYDTMTLAQFNDIVDLGPSNAGGFDFLRGSSSSEDDRYFPSAKGWSQDTGSATSGTGYRTMVHETNYDTDYLNQHSHVHAAKSVGTHSHSLTIDRVSYNYTYRGLGYLNTQTQTDVDYKVVPPAIGVLWITRIY